MKIDANHLKRFKEVGSLLWKYGRSDLVSQLKLEGVSQERNGNSSHVPAEELADDLEAMGPTYVKLGQVLSGRLDLLPEPYLKALERLQDKVKPFSYGEVEQIILSELGVRISKAFAEFDPKPIAAASLGQVHMAALRDGRRVVVKVQRPNIRPQIAEDFEVLAQIADLLDAHTDTGRRYRFASVLEELRLSIQLELNYEQEAMNLVAMAENLKEFPLIQVPQPIKDYCTRCVLTMEYIPGRKITQVSPVVRLDLNGALLAEELFRAYLKQVLVDGLFHADPHPGNVFLTDDCRIALLDLGMVGHTTPGMQEKLLRLLLAVCDGKSDEAADIVIAISERAERVDEAQFRRRVGQIVVSHQDRNLHELNVGKSLLDASGLAVNNGFRVPPELTLLAKTLLQLDNVGKTLHPEFDPHESIRRNSADLLTKRLRKQVTPGNLFTGLLELKDFATALPSRLNRVMDAFAKSEVEFKVRSMDAKMVVEAFQKIANRITMGIVLAALIVGAALLMRVQTRFEIFGYPGLAILCFLAAAAGGFWLVVSILVQDHKDPRKPPG